jgi:hypothetical protein
LNLNKGGGNVSAEDTKEEARHQRVMEKWTRLKQRSEDLGEAATEAVSSLLSTQLKKNRRTFIQDLVTRIKSGETSKYSGGEHGHLKDFEKDDADLNADGIPTGMKVDPNAWFNEDD